MNYFYKRFIYYFFKMLLGRDFLMLLLQMRELGPVCDLTTATTELRKEAVPEPLHPFSPCHPAHIHRIDDFLGGRSLKIPGGITPLSAGH